MAWSAIFVPFNERHHKAGGQGQVILPSRRLEVMDIKKNGAGEENTRGEKESRVSFVLTVLSCAVTSRHLLRRLSQRTSL